MEVVVGPCLCGQPEKVIEENGKQVIQRCPLYIKLRGNNPQGGEVDEWACAIAWLPILLVENSKEVRQGAAATESFRNIMFRLAAGESPAEIMKSEYKGLIENGS